MATITALPLHLVADILGMLPNVQHLPNVLMSHRIFYNAYVDNPSLIIDMLRLQVPENLLPLAVAAYTSQKSFRDRNGIDPVKFMAEHYDKPFASLGGSYHISLDQALYISRLDDALNDMRNDFCTASLYKLHDLSREFPMPPELRRLSDGEFYRISRAMYRFHIYGNLFLDGEDAEQYDESHKAAFFDCHSPWVNEQLACVCDFLETKLTGVMLGLLSQTPACAQLVINGFEWGGNLTEWLTSRSQVFEEQRCLSLGLADLHHLFKARTCEEWQASLDGATNLCESTLEDDLVTFNRRKKTTSGNSGTWTVEEMDKLAQEVDSDENSTDDHPRRMWSKIYYDSVHERFRFGAHAWAPMRFVYGLRSVGYVMWDQGRMEDEATKATIARAYRGEPV
ncbi:hypothetical protein BGZ63DRAFT_365648 [Mariannaea sp. PMI_226]|nr:hypothetical protein BGZ63DRAFT_365648 [Mariannaea sp. PMI_226]